MNELLEKCLMRQDGLKLEGATLPESLSQLCLDATVSCIESFENRHNRRDWISAIEAYRQQGFNLQVLTLSWKELQIAQTALKPDGGNVLSSLDRKNLSSRMSHRSLQSIKESMYPKNS